MKKKYMENKTDKDAWREKSIIEFAYLVKHIAARFAMRLPSSVFFDELVSAGSLGLIDAVDKFDPSKHVSLKTYAQYRIKGAILDELRSMDTYSRSMRKKIQDITKAVKAVEEQKRSSATDEEICRELNVSLETYHDMLTNIHGASILSLDEFIKTKQNDTSSKTRFQSGIKEEDNPADSFDREEIKHTIVQTIKLTLKESGEVLSLTESRICQIHTAVLLKLKARLQDYFK